ncbi:MAG: hypothetical protein PVJ38_01185 [Candidatus Bathyarchaeota archaeon]|jgi:hypothetical protein
MSDEKRLTFSKLAVNILGVILLALGIVIAYYSNQANLGYADPGIFTPIGLLVALLGGLMTAAWEG